MPQYNLIASTTESTVVAEYTPQAQRSESYQSEAALEREFIRMLEAQGYEYLTIHDEAGLVANLRRQLELLNDYTIKDADAGFDDPSVLEDDNSAAAESASDEVNIDE